MYKLASRSSKQPTTATAQAQETLISPESTSTEYTEGKYDNKHR